MVSSMKFELRPPTFPVRRVPRNTARDLLKLQKAAQQIGSILDLDLLLDRIVNETAILFGCLEASIWLHDSVTNEMVLTGVRGCTVYKKGMRLKVGEQGLIGRVAATGQICYTPDVRLDATYIACEPDTLSEIDIPLVVDDQVIGVFSAVHPEVDGFPPQQVRLLQGLAAHIAVAVQNARLFQQERAEKERMSQEAEEASLIQQSLFPKSSPWMPGFSISGKCVPARTVAGDWYDYLPLDNGRWGLVLADVSGKGMAAALLMSATRAILRSLVENDPGPSSVLSRLNRVLLNDFPCGRFVTMVYGVLDPVQRTLTFANAGHPWPLLLNPDKAEFLETEAGLPLGVAEGLYPERSVKLAAGSRLLLYSDGITEAVNQQQEEFGPERLREHILRSRDLTADHLLHGIRQFAGGRPLPDDATVILINSTQSKAKAA